MATARPVQLNAAKQNAHSLKDVYLTFQRVVTIPSGRTILALMSNGKEYVVHLSDIPETDSSGIQSCRVSRHRDYVLVIQESGNRIDLPWDAVLYHAEPDYPYYKGRASQQREEKETAQRIGAQLRALRKRRGLTVTALAQAAGMERPNLSRLEHGKHLPSLATLERVAKALRVPVAELVAAD
ncbi:MAG: XRE family transcriptional regulator [Dehalococcoidia bacterium]|nr:XRE family transcriptional regulator [Dehalococcoidia bacterium]